MIMKTQRLIAQSIFESREALEHELLTEAKMLRDRANALIAVEDAVNRRKPPCALAVKTDGKAMGPRIVWIRYTSKKYNVKNIGPVRFTQEIPGRVRGKYRKSIFSKFDPDLQDKLWEIEGEAAELRKRISFWRAVLKEMEQVLEETDPQEHLESDYVA